MKIIIVVICLALLFNSTGCATVPKRNPVPKYLVEKAHLPGMPMARIWGDVPAPYMTKLKEMPEQQIRDQYPALYGVQHNYLAISGGGDDGAFGAGVMVGWTKSGQRPEFTIVTGISTGALIAPFAFLGPEYDHLLKKLYTTFSTEDLIEQNTWLEIATGDCVFSTEPMRLLINKYYTDDIFEKIAREHAKGRMLFIGTTNLDVGRPVIWDIGAIAEKGMPEDYELCRQLILASASIPVAFTPALIEVEAQGEYYDELHVDGGATSQIFLFPMGINWGELKKKLKMPDDPNIYLIRNARMVAEWNEVDLSIVDIASNSLSSLIRSQGIGDLSRLYVSAKEHGMEFNLVFIPGCFDAKSDDLFDKSYMNKLFDFGYSVARDGTFWFNVPPESLIEQEVCASSDYCEKAAAASK